MISEAFLVYLWEFLFELVYVQEGIYYGWDIGLGARKSVSGCATDFLFKSWQSFLWLRALASLLCKSSFPSLLGCGAILIVKNSLKSLGREPFIKYYIGVITMVVNAIKK